MDVRDKSKTKEKIVAKDVNVSINRYEIDMRDLGNVKRNLL